MGRNRSNMSAAVARRRKQLAKKKEATANEADAVALHLEELLSSDDKSEETAYEALQLAQSLVRKKANAKDASGATELAYASALTLLEKKNRVAVSSQLLVLLLDIFSELHVEETEDWLTKLEVLHSAHQLALDETKGAMSPIEVIRLQRLQRDWLRRCVHWSSEYGAIRFGHFKLQELLGNQSWALATLLQSQGDATEVKLPGATVVDDDDDDIMDACCDAVIHMALAEKPEAIAKWLAMLPAPTTEETKTGHGCPPGVRDAIFTRAVLCMCAMENLRDANVLVQKYILIESRDLKTNLVKSYVDKDDGVAPSHLVFATSLLRVCEKDARTGPLFSWLLRSFKKELDQLHKPQIVLSYTTKIGKAYFNIQPPPSMMSMMENMMNMMGGGGAPGGMPGVINPAMMQAAMAQMQQAGMM
jgi:Golgi to ER traffic protein 4